MAENKSTEGEPMFVESLMTPTEWGERKRLYKTKLGYDEAHRSKPNLFKWRFRMGASSTVQEIELFNKRMDILKEKANIINYAVMDDQKEG